MAAEKKDRRRLQVDFAPEAFDKIRELRDMADARTSAELVRNALRLYEWYLGKMKHGYRLQLVKGDEVKEVELIF